MKSVKIKCYKCKKTNKLNVGVGKEEKKSYWSKKVPIELAMNLLNKVLTCEKCKTEIYIGSTHSEFITLNTYPKRKV